MAELNVRQDRFLKALLECASVDQACKKAGINRIWKMLNNRLRSTFAKAINNFQRLLTIYRKLGGKIQKSI